MDLMGPMHLSLLYNSQWYLFTMYGPTLFGHFFAHLTKHFVPIIQYTRTVSKIWRSYSLTEHAPVFQLYIRRQYYIGIKYNNLH